MQNYERSSYWSCFCKPHGWTTTKSLLLVTNPFVNWRKRICGWSPARETSQRHQSFIHSQHSTTAFLWLLKPRYWKSGIRQMRFFFILKSIDNMASAHRHTALRFRTQTSLEPVIEEERNKKSHFLDIFCISWCNGYNRTILKSWPKIAKIFYKTGILVKNSQ